MEHGSGRRDRQWSAAYTVAAVVWCLVWSWRIGRVDAVAAVFGLAILVARAGHHALGRAAPRRPTPLSGAAFWIVAGLGLLWASAEVSEAAVRLPGLPTEAAAPAFAVAATAFLLVGLLKTAATDTHPRCAACGATARGIRCGRCGTDFGRRF